MDLFCHEVLNFFGEPAPKIKKICDKPLDCLLITMEDMQTFFSLLENRRIRKFLDFDKFFQYADKYLIAMVITYFKRAGYTYEEYTIFNFFVALYLAHDMEEDEEELKCIITRWAFGFRWEVRQNELLSCRDRLWRVMNYRAVVSRKCCEEVMSMLPDHPIWRRQRSEEYGGARRDSLDKWCMNSPSRRLEIFSNDSCPEIAVCNANDASPYSVHSTTGEKKKTLLIDDSGKIYKENKGDGLPTTEVCVQLDDGIRITFHLPEE